MGKALHTLQDSYAGGHTDRTTAGIMRFHDYNLQSAHEHAKDDSPLTGSPSFTAAQDSSRGFMAMAMDFRLTEPAIRSVLEQQYHHLAPGAVAGGTLPKYELRSTRIKLGP